MARSCGDCSGTTRWDEEAASSDRQNKLSVLTHSQVQGGSGHAESYHGYNRMRSGRKTEHTFDSLAGRKNRASDANLHHAGIDTRVFHATQGPCGDRSWGAFSVGERSVGRARTSGDSSEPKA